MELIDFLMNEILRKQSPFINVVMKNIRSIAYQLNVIDMRQIDADVDLFGHYHING